MNVADLQQIDRWQAAQCIAYLEQHGGIAPEYDLEASGLDMLRRDCKEKALRDRRLELSSTRKGFRFRQDSDENSDLVGLTGS